MLLPTLVGSLFGLLLSGVWIGAALGLTGIIIMMLWGGGVSLLGTTVWNAINHYALAAIPGFLFMGQILLQSGIGTRMYDSLFPLMARFPGKLLHSNIFLSAMFAAVLGISTANAAIVGSVAIPELRKRKYDEGLLLGTVCMGGTLGILIPPSAALILYGVMAEVSIAGLFAAGMIPGLLMALFFMSYIGIKGIITPGIAPTEEKALPFRATLRSVVRIWPVLVISIATLVPIYVGLVTTTEAAGVGALASMIMARLFGKLDWQRIKTSLINAAELSAMIFFLVTGAMILSISISSLGIPRALVVAVGGLQVSPMIIFAVIFVMYLVLGCFIDTISLMIMSIPFVCPILRDLGFDMIWFGIMLILVIEMGLVTPPVGLNLFVTQAIAGPGTTMMTVARGSVPFLLLTLVVVVLLAIFPEIVTFLPRILGFGGYV